MDADDRNRDIIIDAATSAEVVIRRLARCDRCQTALACARRVGPDAMAVRRCQFVRCVARSRA